MHPDDPDARAVAGTVATAATTKSMTNLNVDAHVLVTEAIATEGIATEREYCSVVATITVNWGVCKDHSGTISTSTWHGEAHQHHSTKTT